MDQTDQMDLENAVAKKRSVLVLATIAERTFPQTDGSYIFLPHFWNRPVLYADEPVKWIYNENGAAIRSYAEVLNRVAAQTAKEAELVRTYSPLKVVRREISVEWETDAHKELYAGSAVLIGTVDYRKP